MVRMKIALAMCLTLSAIGCERTESVKEIGPDRDTPFLITEVRPGALRVAIEVNGELQDQGWIAVNRVNLEGRTVSYFDWEHLP